MNKKIILASRSPRRKELLSGVIHNFDIMADDSEEKIESGMAPEEVVMHLAMQKAANIAEKITEDALVIGADTVVSIDGGIFGKPSDEDDAKRMLKTLSGRENFVCTGVAVVDTSSGRAVCDYERTGVVFRALTEREIAAYIKTGEPMDKAGAYGVQGVGALFVKEINGDYFNVVGLPLCKLGRMLEKEFGYNIL